MKKLILALVVLAATVTGTVYAATGCCPKNACCAEQKACCE